MGSTTVLVLVIATALVFDFTNGFHDTANAVATSIATGALRPRVAALLCGALKVVGAFISLKVATMIAKGIVDSSQVTLTILSGALLSGFPFVAAASASRSGRSTGRASVRPESSTYTWT